MSDVAIVGAGIVGLAHAYVAAKQGLKVTVYDRSPQAVGASIRNFGMIWPIGQPRGPLRERAFASRAVWQQLSEAAGFDLEPCGSLHLAYREDELAVLEEFVATEPECRLLTVAETLAKSPIVREAGLLGALWSPTEMTVDPRQAIANVAAYLEAELGVVFRWHCAVTAIEPPYVMAAGEQCRAERIIVCSGADFETLYPAHFRRSGITKVKLQMLRTVPQPLRVGPSICGGLTLTHYSSFSHCASLAALKARIEAETPHFPAWGIHVMLSQQASGECTLGDSHEYGLNPSPFDRDDIDRWILDYLGQMVQLPQPQIQQRWHGIYAKLPGKTAWRESPSAGVWLVNALGGAGMTLSFGLAQETFGMLTEERVA